jgi:integrase
VREDGWYQGRHRGQFCAALYVGGKRKGRVALGKDAEAAAREIRRLNTERERDKISGAPLTNDSIFGLYIDDRKKAKKAAIDRMKQCRQLIKPHFGHLLPTQVDKTLCDDYIDARRNLGVADATIRTEMTYLSVALRFAADTKLISKADVPRIWRPSQGRARSEIEDFHLTRPEAELLLEACQPTPHLRLWVILSLGTAGRPLHILQLTWDRVDFHGGTINLDDPGRDRTAKGRARVPMNEEVHAALLEARQHADPKSPYVITWNGKPLKRVKGAFERAAKRAELDISPYALRHTAAVWMAEDGVPLEEIAQYMGHTNIEITRKHYARYTPTYLRRAASSLRVVRGSTGTSVPEKWNTSGTEQHIGRRVAKNE